MDLARGRQILGALCLPTLQAAQQAHDQLPPCLRCPGNWETVSGQDSF